MRISDWSSDVCSSDLKMTTARSRQLARSWSMDLPPPDDSGEIAVGVKGQRTILFVRPTGALNEADEPMWIEAVEGLARADAGDREGGVLGTGVSVRVDLGGRRIIKKKTIQ